MTLPGTPQQNTARTMSSALKRRVTCMVVGLTLLLMTCLMLLPSVDGRLSEDSKENKSWALWAGDPKGSRCLKYKTRFGVNLPRVWLLSFPASGNTWTRYLLEAASGIFTGSVYVDKNLIKNGKNW
ncbi:WSCD family member [Chionoecetes opilio]|uniref:WSCD family member n=1 Tax=Chionoecetes opilio TaxID=41210 RepID=A0A8J4XMJ8_CHIOP|nr:WSCD family member [Chionoecetes opilio]